MKLLMLGISKFSTNEGRCLIGAEESPFISANFIKSYQKSSWPRLMKEVYKKRKRSTFWPYSVPSCPRVNGLGSYQAPSRATQLKTLNQKEHWLHWDSCSFPALPFSIIYF